MSAARLQLVSSQLGDGEPDYINGAVPDDYQIREEPLYSKAPIKVVCIGAGVSGLATAVRVQQTLKNVDFEIYEKNAELGGTWLENRYPGCACMLLVMPLFICNFANSSAQATYRLTPMHIHSSRILIIQDSKPGILRYCT